MKKTFTEMLLSAILTLPAIAAAEGSYAGLNYGNLESEDADMKNIGVTIGVEINEFFSIESALTTTASGEDLGSGIELSSDTIAIFGALRSQGDFYAKAKLGLSRIELDLENDVSSVSDDDSGIAYGFGVGARFENVLFEAEFTRLPELEEFQGIQMNAENNFVSLGVLVKF